MSTGLNINDPLQAKRALLASRFCEEEARVQLLPLSSAQERLWFLDQLEPNSSLYHIATLTRLKGRLDLAALEHAVSSVVGRHEALRVRFMSVEGVPHQVIEPPGATEVRLIDLSALEPSVARAEADRLVAEELKRPFQLSAGKLLRTTLLRFGPDHHQLLLLLHHIVADEWSLGVLFRELGAFYGGFVQRQSVRLPELPIQYADYALWQRDRMRPELLEPHLAYWRARLESCQSVTALPTDRLRRPVPTFRGETLWRVLSPEILPGVAKLAAECESTPFMLFLAAFMAVVHRYNYQENLVVGSPVAGRNRVETEGLIGFFVNTLPLKASFANNPTFRELLRRVRESALGAFAHQELPFEKLVEDLRPDRSLSHMPFTNLMFVFQADPLDGISWPGLELEFLEVAGDTSKFDLTLNIKCSRQGLRAAVEFNRDLFETATVKRLLGHFETLLTAALCNPQLRISELLLLTEVERREMLVEWNDTRTDYPRHSTVHRLFEKQAVQAGNSPAVICGEQVLSYGALNARANQLAHFLRQLGIGPHCTVGVCLERSPELIVAFLAVLKAGAAYVPLDPGYPRERLAFMLEDSRSAALLTDSTLPSWLPSASTKVVCLDKERLAIARQSEANPVAQGEGESLAYIMYTSGSTGRPKGVAVPHRAINRLVLNTNYLRLNKTDRIAQVSNASFDAATFEVWGALLNGAALVCFSRDVILSPADFGRDLGRQGITTMFLTSALFNQVASEAPGSFEKLRTLIVGGEALDPKSVRAVLSSRPPHRLVNGYGPTENTSFSCCHLIREVLPDASQVPIGKPIANSEAYVLDPHLQPVPIGVPGELFVGGDGLAQGYWANPELTAEKFISHPFAPAGAGRRLYRTGDLARYRADGAIEFLGRLDDQVKVRGFRIELGEVESVLACHPNVSQCAVAVKTGSSGDKKIVAYVRPAEGRAIDSGEVRSFLALTLPEYMLPASFVIVPSFQLTVNGKIDRHSLPEPDQVRPALERTCVGPRDDVEAELVRIWESVLDVGAVGITDKFFQLGGHSLLAVRVLALIEKRFRRKLRLATLFQSPTIEQLAVFLREGGPAPAAPATSLVEIQALGSQPPLFLVHGAGGGMFWGYINLSRHLGDTQPVYGFKSRGLDGRQEIEQIEQMAAQYVRDLRSLQPQGPYYLGGYCFGGNVAYEMARQLTEQRQEVALLALFNCAPPNSQYMKIPWTPVWGLRLVRNLVYWVDYFGQWTSEQRREFFRWKWTSLRKRIRGLGSASAKPLSGFEVGDLVDLSAYTPEERQTWEAHLRALISYHPQPFAGRVHLFRSPGHPLWCSFDPQYGWGELAKGGVCVTVVPGSHEKILQEPCVETLAVELKKVLESARSSSHNPARCQGEAPIPQELPRSSNGCHRVPPGPAANETRRDETPVSLLEGPRVSFPDEAPYTTRFTQIAAKIPSAAAVRFQGQELTYSELNTRANQLARYLQSLGAGPEVLVGICLERSLELAVALLGVLKSGAAYLPLDPNYPRDRLEYMIADSRAGILLTQGSLLAEIRAPQAKVICLDDPVHRARIESGSAANLSNAAGLDTLAYVIYTSGSTGNPKGVQVTHRALMNHNLAIAEAYHLQPVDRVLQFTPLSFDISVEEIFPSWLSGCTVILRNEEAISSVKAFLAVLAQEKISVLNLPTAYWHELVSFLDAEGGELPSSLRLIIIGGEKASEAAFQLWKRKAPDSVVLLNGYGATEATVTTTLFQSRPGDEHLPIGRPLANTQVAILDEHLRLVPPQAEGELYIGGAGLARGYLNRPELTKARFILNPFPERIPSERLYKTGDLVRINAQGELEFLGRLDEQVKIRGFRIELGEVESVLQSHPGVKDAAVVAKEDVRGRKRLVAYFVPRVVPGPRVDDLSGFLRKKLPGYMVPAAFVPLDELPLTPAGKVDRRALPTPGNTRPELEQEYVAPRLPVEEALAGIWSEVLELKPIGVNDHFFDLGGDSLLAIQVLSRIRDLLQLDLSLGQFFRRPTISGLAELLTESGLPRGPQLPLSIFTPGSSTPLSAKQRRLWVLEQFHPQCSPYNRPVGVRLEGPLDLAALKQSLSALASRHDGSRAVFPSSRGEPAQFICAAGEIPLPVVDLTAVPENERGRTALIRVAQESRRPHIGFHPLLRPMLLRLGEREHWLVLVLHEIGADSRSVRVLLAELANLYRTFALGEPSQLAPLRARYQDAIIEEEHLTPLDEQEQIDYWVRTLQDAPALLELPADQPRPARTPGTGARKPVFFPSDWLSSVEALGRQQNCDLLTTLLTGFSALLHRYSRADDIVIGSLATRPLKAGMEQLIANFETPLALRCSLAGDPSFLELLARQKQTVSEALTHSAIPFAKLIDLIQPERHGSFARVFQVMLVLEDELPQPTESAGLKFVPFEIDAETAKLDLYLHLVRTPNGLAGWLEYSTPLFGAARIERMVCHLKNLLANAAANPSEPISRLELLSESERDQLLVEWNRTEKEFARSKTVIDLFREQAARSPDAVALVAGSERLSYREVESRARSLAGQLVRCGLQPEDLVGVCLDRSPEMLVSMLAAWMAGGAYVPLDPAYPQERLSAIAQDANLRFMVTRGRFRKLVPIEDNGTICLDDPDDQHERFPLDYAPLEPSSLAYVIYTSGSTGRPKGVALEHRNAMAFVSWALETFAPQELAGVLASTSICFDLSIFELFVPLACGGKVILAENALALPSLPAASEVTLINTVPSAMAELLRARAVPASVQVINLAGEPLSTRLVDQIHSETGVRKVYDLYGPTETTTYSTGALRRPGEPATIGRPLSNEQVYLLDVHLQPVPVGVPGELYIGGAGVARGYLNRPELTAQRFVANPFRPGERLYRTGDLSRWLEDGNLQFLGRADHQVKIRGFRIELGEIESVLKSYIGVREAVVLAREDQPGDKRLVAYVAGGVGHSLNADELRLSLGSKLPPHMVPSAFVLLENLPQTPNGKVDRKQLQAPAPETRRRRRMPVPPRNPIEQQLARIWVEVLHLNEIGIHDNFFDLGGHSLLAAQVASRIREQFRLDLPLLALFTAPTIASLAEGLTAGQWAPDRLPVLPLRRIPRAPRHAVSFVQERLWFLDQLRPGSDAYNVPAALRLKGELDVAALEGALNSVIQRHEALRSHFSYANGDLAQLVKPALALKLVTDEIRDPSHSDLEAAVERWLQAAAQRPFDLAAGPLLRAGLLRLSPNEHVFALVLHHAICDGWSLAIFFRELEAFYRAASSGQPSPALPALPVEYIDFAHWQRQSMQGPALERELGYWKHKLAGAPPAMELPVDHPQSSHASSKAGRRSVLLAKELVETMADLGQQESLTPFMVLMSGLVATLNKWTRQKDLVIGTVVAGRNRRETEDVIGCFMNFLPIRTRVLGTETGHELLGKVKASVLEGQSHQECPFERIVEAVNPERRGDQNPLYNVAFLLQNFPNNLFPSPTLQVSHVPLSVQSALLDLRFEAEQTRDGLSISCEYCAELFESGTIEELLNSFLHVTARLVQSPHARIDELGLTDKLEHQAQAARAHLERERIVVSSTFTAEPLAEPLHSWLNELEVPAAVEFAPFNQVFQQLLDPASLLAGNCRGLNLILLRFEDWCGESGAGQALDGTRASQNIERTLEDFVAALKAAARTAVPWLIGVCPCSARLGDGADPAEVQKRLETALSQGVRGVPGIHLLTSEELLGCYPVTDFLDSTGDELAHVPYTPLFFTALATAVARKFHALKRAPYKVIVLDCDQTLWAGVCGEDGAEGVCLDAPRRALQEFMRAQHESGMLLCLNSKNHEDDVRAVFNRRKEMPLGWEHFAATRLNWQPKSENLKALAHELKLGLDSFIFIDDNPIECAEVEANCPEVLTLQLPEAPSLIPQFLQHCWAFDHSVVTTEDRQRNLLHRQEQARDELRAQAPSMADFLESLELQIRLEPVSADHFARVAQLSQRTNQFNCMGKRFSVADLQSWLSANQGLTVHVRDRFGDYGLVGSVLYRLDDKTLAVDSFLLSCRALGRGVEHGMLARLGEIARSRRLDWVDVHFVPTGRNKPAADFLETVGGNFKQPLHGGSVFRFPAGFAAEVTFQPGSIKNAAASPAKAERETGRASHQSVPLRKFTRCREIALKTLDLSKLHREWEAKIVVPAGPCSSGTAPRTPLERQLCELWQRLLRVEKVAMEDNFFELGGHSLLAVRLFSEIERMLGRKFPLITIFEAPTIEQLAKVLEQGAAAGSDSLLVPIQPRGAKPPLFLVHGAGGDVLWGYKNLAAHMPDDQPVYGIKSRAQLGLEEYPSLSQMAAGYVQVIQGLQPHGPYYLGGYCFGGNVAYEMARQLQARGESVALVALLDSAPSNAGYETVPWWRPGFARRFMLNAGAWLKDFCALSSADRRAFVARKVRALGRKLRRLWTRDSASPLVDLEEVIDPRHFPERELKLWQVHLDELVQHIDQPYPGRVTLLRTRGQPLFCSLEEDFCWGGLARGGAEVCLIPGSHENVFMEPNVLTLAKELSVALSRAHAAQPVPDSPTPVAAEPLVQS